MKYAKILEHLAPCGLSCFKCFAFTRGEIGTHSEALRKQLGNFDIYAERFSSFLPQFKDYPVFKRMLAYFAEPDCGVVTCFQKKGVDFCYQCDEFPCEKTNFDPHLKKRWIIMQTRMQEIGVVAYYEETKDVCRYL